MFIINKYLRVQDNFSRQFDSIYNSPAIRHYEQMQKLINSTKINTDIIRSFEVIQANVSRFSSVINSIPSSIAITNFTYIQNYAESIQNTLAAISIVDKSITIHNFTELNDSIESVSELIDTVELAEDTPDDVISNKANAKTLKDYLPRTTTGEIDYFLLFVTLINILALALPYITPDKQLDVMKSIDSSLKQIIELKSNE